MAQLKIHGNIRIGYIYECYLGNFKHVLNRTTGNIDICDNDYDFRIPNEMIKKRAVIILGKHRGQYIVVPVSSTKETHKKAHKIPEITGLHTRLLAKDFPETKKYKKETLRWAKSNLVMTIDGGRLRDIYDEDSESYVSAHAVSEGTLRSIRFGVMMAIGVRDLIPDD